MSDDVRFPGESDSYRTARRALLDAEIDLRRRTEAVAAMRRALPIGGPIPEDYVFEGESGPVAMSALFAPGQDTLVFYSFMYGPEMAAPCPACTSILDGLDGQAPHLAQQVSLAVVARSPYPRIAAFAHDRGWKRLRFVSAANNDYQRAYRGESAEGKQLPMLNVFSKIDGKVFHRWASELFFAPSDEGQHARHVDALWPLWNVLDHTPNGRGAFHPKLAY